MKIKNLFIIGNGFDLAHGLETDYKSFISNHLIDEGIKSGFIIERRLFLKNDKEYYLIQKSEITQHRDLITKNFFLSRLFKEMSLNNWVDIETLYFELLKSKNYEVKKLNSDFSIIKNELENYLVNVTDKKIGNYLSSFFDSMSKKKEDSFMVLNFNYTNTFDLLYQKAFKECPIINIHGELKNKDNPIVFGYASTDKETIDLIKEGNNELLKNIKRYYYKRTDSLLQLNQFLNDGSKKDIHVHILGHSCGVSDRNILKNIFVNEYVKEINIMYYNNYVNYFDTLVNIDRVVENNKQYGIINNYQKSIRMPQFDDNEELTAKSLTLINHVTNIKRIPANGVNIR